MKINKDYFIVTILILLAAIARIVTHELEILPNFAPIAAIGIFGAINFKNKFVAWLVPLCSMIISDSVIGFSKLSLFIYAAFIIIVGITMLNKSSFNFRKLIPITLASSLIFFVISNFGVWALGGYTYDLKGLIECYVMAIPFYVNSLAGDIFYTSVLFGLFEMYKYAFLTAKVKA